MKKIMSFLVIVIMLMVGVKTPKAQQTCYDGVCFPKGDVSFADSYISYDVGAGVKEPNNNPSSAEGSPDYQYDQDGSYVSLGCYGVLVVKFTDNSLTTSGDTNEDLWIFEIGSEVEPTNIDISTDGVNWIEVGSTSGATSGIDLDAYTGYGVVVGEHYSYVRIEDKGCTTGSPYGGADIDAVGAIESADPVTTTTTEPATSTTTVPDTLTTTTSIINIGFSTTTTTAPVDTTTTTTYCPITRDCGDICCGEFEACQLSSLCISIFICPAEVLYGEDSEEVEQLRAFRDEVLSQTLAGQEIIRLYYEWSPVIVQTMENDSEFKDWVTEQIEEILLLTEGTVE